MSKERGSVVLFLTVYFPIIMLGMALVFDFSKIFIEREQAKKIAFETAKIGASSLPYKEDAEQKMLRYLNENGFSEANIEIEEDKVKINISSGSSLFFSKYFTKKERAQYRVSSTVGISSSRVALFLDTSSYMGPPLGDSVWGGQVDQYTQAVAWAEANLFKQDEFNPKNTRYEEKQNLTQQCYNPSFNAMKEALIRYYDFVSASKTTKVSVLSGSSSSSFKPLELKPMDVSDLFDPEEESAKFDFYRNQNVADDYCLKIASEENNIRFKIPEISKKIREVSSNLSNRIEFTNKHYLKKSKANNLTTREVVWTKAVQRQLNSEDKVVRYDEVLESVVKSLLAASIEDPPSAINNYLGVIFLGDMPHVEDSDQGLIRMFKKDYDANLEEPKANKKVKKIIKLQLEDLNNIANERGIKVQIVTVILRHQGNYNALSPWDIGEKCRPFTALNYGQMPCKKFTKEADVLKYLFDEQSLSNIKNIELDFVFAPSYGSLVNDIINKLPLVGRKIRRI